MLVRRSFEFLFIFIIPAPDLRSKASAPPLIRFVFAPRWEPLNVSTKLLSFRDMTMSSLSSNPEARFNNVPVLMRKKEKFILLARML